MAQVSLIHTLDDNYIYTLEDTSHTLMVDPGEALPALEYLEKKQLKLDAILLTHHHSDHIGGISALVEKYQPKIYGPKDDRLDCVDHVLEETDSALIERYNVQVLFTPGHTSSHLVYYFKDLGIAFTGDTLFACGCGMLFEKGPQEMFESLEKLKKLPSSTQIYCGHEYTQKNIEFALSVDPDNLALKKRYQQVVELRKNNKPTIPSTVELELQTNPFMRCFDAAIRKNLNLEQASDVEVFAKLRSLKDSFK